MKSVIIGGNGFIGYNMCKYLSMRNDNTDIIVIDDYSTSGISEDKQRWYNDVGIEIFPCDIGNKERFLKNKALRDAISGSDIIYNFAAKARVQLSIENCVSYHDTNITGLLHILEIAKELGIRRVINSSSSSVYGMVINSNIGSHEDDTLRPMSPYALQKKVGEELCEMYSDIYGVDTVSLRYFNVYGEGMYTSGGYKLVMGHWLESYRNNTIGVIYGDGKQQRDFTYVGDVISANYKCGISSKNFNGRRYNIGNGNPVELNDIANIYRSVLGIDFRNEESKHEPYITHANNERARIELNWEPTMDVKEWLSKYLKDYILNK